MLKFYRFTLLLFTVFLFAGKGYCQRDTVLPKENIIGTLFKAKLLSNGQSPLYNGYDYTGYPANYFKEGNQFWASGNWSIGSVSYEGKNYDSVAMRYDLVKDELIIQHPNKVLMINLVKSKVQGFTIACRQFINMKPAGADFKTINGGYYELLYANTNTLLAHREKSIVESITEGSVTRNIKATNKYMVLKNGNYYPIDGETALLNVFKDKKADLLDYIKRSKIKFNQEPEKAMIAIIAYYNLINK